MPETGLPAASGLARARSALRCGNILQRDGKYKPAAAFFRRCAHADDSEDQIAAREARTNLSYCINMARADAADANFERKRQKNVCGFAPNQLLNG